MNYSWSDSSAHGILQARILEWIAISSSRGSSQPRDGTSVSCISCIGRWFYLFIYLFIYFFTIVVTWEARIVNHILVFLQIQH